MPLLLTRTDLGGNVTSQSATSSSHEVVTRQNSATQYKLAIMLASGIVQFTQYNQSTLIYHKDHKGGAVGLCNYNRYSISKSINQEQNSRSSCHGGSLHDCTSGVR